MGPRKIMSKTNGIETLKVGDKAVPVQCYYGSGSISRRFGEVTIARVTATTIVDTYGTRYRMSDGAKMPAASSDHRYLMSLAAFETATKVTT